MTKNEQPAITNISVDASNADVAAVLKAQYGHLENGEVRAMLEVSCGPVWTNDELLEVFEVSHFEPPYVHVIRKEDGKRGTVMFVDTPRFYFSFTAEENHE
ncbi:MAG: hypothetical protein EBZ69_00425 [Alphaproteobacteria bacterium]|nr:hypothetical protein [Alphaproteobacteria bacterium]